VIGVGVASALLPVVGLGIVHAVGFLPAGIAAGSVAAKLMSVSAIANGGGVVAGGAVATLQSVGTCVVGFTTSALSGLLGSTAAASVIAVKSNLEDGKKSDSKL